MYRTGADGTSVTKKDFCQKKMHYINSNLDNPFVFQGGDEEHRERMRGADWPRQQGP